MARRNVALIAAVASLALLAACDDRKEKGAASDGGAPAQRQASAGTEGVQPATESGGGAPTPESGPAPPASPGEAEAEAAAASENRDATGAAPETPAEASPATAAAGEPVATEPGAAPAAGEGQEPSAEGGPAAAGDTQIAALPPDFTPPARTLETAEGPILVDVTGMALYVFDDDAPGQSNCLDRCAENWPPLTAHANDVAGGAWGIIPRDDGRRQWTYRGRPLYTWTNDKKPGDTTGDNVNDTWHLARP